MSILVTGYEPETGGLNASKVLIESMRDDAPSSLLDFGSVIHYEVMPLSTVTIKAAFLEAIERHNPALCVFTGQAPGRNRITFERFATNLKDFESPDGEGAQPRGELIEADAPAAYRSTLPHQESLIDCLNRCEIPAGFSNHAGNHLCNQLLYHGLHHANTTGRNIQCGFVHIPILPLQIMQNRSAQAFMPLAMLRQGLALILAELAVT